MPTNHMHIPSGALRAARTRARALFSGICCPGASAYTYVPVPRTMDLYYGLYYGLYIVRVHTMDCTEVLEGKMYSMVRASLRGTYLIVRGPRYYVRGYLYLFKVGSNFVISP